MTKNWEETVGLPSKEPSRCSLCGERLSSEDGVAVGLLFLCEDCFYQYQTEGETIKEHAEDFCRKNLSDYLHWWFSGDAFLDREDQLEILYRGYLQWKGARPGEAREAQEEFARDSPSQWEEYLREL